VPNWVITGKLGAGKSLVAVSKIREALEQGRQVATNLDLRLDKLMPSWWTKGKVTRVPDFPLVADLDALGLGGDSRDERRFGLLVLDECAAWLNARSWGDRERHALITWFRHARKLRWSCMFLTQDIDDLDKQLRKALAEYVVWCRRLDRMKMAGYKMPRVHVGVVRYGTRPDAPVSERWVYRGSDLFEAYDTEQVFVPRDDPQAVVENQVLPMPGLDPANAAKRPTSWLARALGLARKVVARPVVAPVQWPQSVMQLAPDTRWQLARSLASRSDWAGVRPGAAQAISLGAANATLAGSASGATAGAA
jgi:hypothetical protein